MVSTDSISVSKTDGVSSNLTQPAKVLKTLGMSFGKASWKLRQAVMLSLLERLGLNSCYRCSKPMTINDLTLDHKKNWRWDKPDLFWDVENIAFSHKGCNSGAKRNVGTSGMPSRFRKTPIITGTSWCEGHQDFLPLTQFTKNKTNWDGLEKSCVECRKKRPSRRPKF